MRRKRFCWIGILLALLVLGGMAQAQGSENLLSNGGFEQVDASGNPADWYVSMYRKQEGYSRVTVTEEKAHSGTRSALIESVNMNDARLICRISVEPDTLYRFSGYVWVESMTDQGNGANLALEDIFAHSDGIFEPSAEWRYLEWYGLTGPSQWEAELGVRIGGYGAESVGKAYFDDIHIAKVTALPAGVSADLWYKDVTPVEPIFDDGVSTPEKSTALFVLMALAFTLLAALCNPLLRKGEGKLEVAEGREHSATLVAVFGLLITIAFVLRVVLGWTVAGHSVDIGCFSSWSQRMASVGPANFYSPDYFCDYPPGSMLLLWPVGLVLKSVGTANTPGMLLTLKALPILCDMVIAIFLFAFARKRISGKAAAFIALLYALNPASLVNGAAWGQMDSVLALFMLLVAVFAMERKWMAAIPLFVVGALVKPQALLLAPVGVVWLIASLIWGEDRKKQLLNTLWGVLIALACAVAIVFPFAVKQEAPVAWLTELYSDTLSSYGFATVNTANLYYLLGANWKPLDTEAALLLPLCTGLLLVALGLWETRLYKGGKALSESFRVMRESSRKKEAPAQRDRRHMLGLLSLFAGTVFLLLAILGTTYQTYGMAMMMFIFAWVCIGVATERDGKNLFFWLALALIGIYVLGIKIHERYLFVAIPLLLAGYATTRDKRLLGLCVGFSATTFVNTAIVLDNCILFGREQGHLNADTLVLNAVLCILNAALCLYAGYVSLTGPRETPRASAKWDALPPEENTPEGRVKAGCPKRGDSYRKALLNPRDARLRLSVRDFLIMGIAMVVYSFMTFVNLGSTVAPQNGWVSTSPEEQIVFQVEMDVPYTLIYYAGVSHNPFSVSVSSDGVNWSENYPCEMREGLCYRWQYAILTGETGAFLDNRPENRLWLTGRYLRLNAGGAGLNLMEIVARNEAGETLPIRIGSHTGARDSVLDSPKPADNLIDEQNTLVGEPGWFNGTYFDEIYHARTAYEHLHGQAPYETTHPPLGKLMMSAAIEVFGMTPFGWRFAGALVGVLMLPALYLLAKQIFRRRDLAAFSMLLLMFDLMHFTQTRIATIDSFPVFFIMISYLCMVRYVMMDVFVLGEGESTRLFTRGYRRSLVPLALSGLFMGLSIASKWIGLYSAIGLAVLFFTAIYRQYRVGNMAFDYPVGEEDGEAAHLPRARLKAAQDHTLSRIFITCGFCLIFFVAVPALIYYLSYIPYLSPTGPVTIDRIAAAQESMLKYHATPGLGMDHPFQSPWYEWPFILKPMWFAQDKFEPEGFASTIMCMGNPLIFYVGAVCMMAVLIAFVRRYVSLRDGLHLEAGDGNMSLAVMVIGFLAQYLPWVLVPRSMYIYHYFASVPFIILATAWMMSHLPEERKRLRSIMLWGYVALVAVFFVMFYPYASGVLAPNGWFAAMKWFSRLYY